MNRLTRKELIFMGIALFFGVIILISFIWLNFFRQSPKVIEITAPSSPPFPYSSSGILPDPSVQIPGVTISPSSGPRVGVDPEKIDNLIKILPYKGTFTRLEYEKDNNIFIYLYRREFPEESDKELNDFLKKNGFEDRKMLDQFGLDEYYY